MEIGPFNVREVEQLTELFESQGVTFEVIVAEDEREKILAEYHEKTTMNHHHLRGSLDLKFIYFEITPEDFEKVSGELEKYGIVKSSDGSFELGD